MPSLMRGRGRRRAAVEGEGERWATTAPRATYLSPALALSTISPRRMTSRVRGMHPGGISEAFSCTRSRCQSTNFDRSLRSCHSVRLTHDGFLHLIGCVYLNCCATGSEMVPHISHWKKPCRSSGRTSDVRVTVAANELRLAMRSVRSSRSAEMCGRLKKETWKSRSAAYSSWSEETTRRTDTRRCGSSS